MHVRVRDGYNIFKLERLLYSAKKKRSCCVYFYSKQAFLCVVNSHVLIQVRKVTLFIDTFRIIKKKKNNFFKTYLTPKMCYMLVCSKGL